MLKIRIIPVLTFNGLALVKTRKFSSPRMVGNPVQAARVFNGRQVDELVFLDITASAQNRKINFGLVEKVIKECYMPVGIGGGISSIEDINTLLKIGADKVIIKTKALTDESFIKEAVRFFGSQCITIAVDAYFSQEEGVYKIYNNLDLDILLASFIEKMEACKVGEFIINSVDRDGLMEGFDTDLLNQALARTNIPVIAVGGAGNLLHVEELFKSTKVEAMAASSIFHFTQYTPLDIKNKLKGLGRSVRI